MSINVLVIQRQSLVAGVEFSLSVYARILEAIEWLAHQNSICYAICGELDNNIIHYLKWADIVIFNKHFSERAQYLAREAKNLRCITVLDIDDLITAFPSYSGASPDLPTGKTSVAKNNFAKMLDLVDHLTVANQRLLKIIQPLRSDCTLIPNGIYIEKYPSPVVNEIEPLRCVFTNADYLKIHNFKNDFIRVLQDFHRQYPDIIFDFFGDPFPELYRLPFLHYTRRLPYNKYIISLIRNRYAYAITPLGSMEDTKNYQFNSCKNPFKFLNYGVAGIPCIYSRTPIYEECIIDGETGILAYNTYDDWMGALEKIHTDKSLRHSIKRNSYEYIRKNFHISKSAQCFMEIFSKYR